MDVVIRCSVKPVNLSSCLFDSVVDISDKIIIENSPQAYYGLVGANC